MSRILVTGGSGFIGGRLISALSRLDPQLSITNMDIRPPKIQYSSVRHIRVDLTSLEQLRGLSWDFDFVYHLAAMVDVRECQRRPDEAEKINVEAITTLMGLLPSKASMVFASSAAVYGETTDDEPISERHRVAPISAYGTQKLKAERMILGSTDWGKRAAVFRFFNVFGRGQDPQSGYAGVLTKFVAAHRGGRPIRIFGDGKQTRDYVYIQDLVEMLSALAVNREFSKVAGKVLNVGSGQSVSILELVPMIESALGRPFAGVTFEPRNPEDIQYSRADTGLYKRAFQDQHRIRSIAAGMIVDEFGSK